MTDLPLFLTDWNQDNRPPWLKPLTGAAEQRHQRHHEPQQVKVHDLGALGDVDGLVEERRREELAVDLVVEVQRDREFTGGGGPQDGVGAELVLDGGLLAGGERREVALRVGGSGKGRELVSAAGVEPFIRHSRCCGRVGGSARRPARTRGTHPDGEVLDEHLVLLGGVDAADDGGEVHGLAAGVAAADDDADLGGRDEGSVRYRWG
jgi:hypothetical protein